jgi:site-specific DNA recombinase
LWTAGFTDLCVEVFQDADRSGKETSRRGDYLRMLERIKGAAAGEIAAVASYDIDRLHRNDLEFFRFMAEMAERRILVFDSSGLVSAVDQLPWKVKAIVAQEERVKVARRVRDNLRYLKRTGHLLGVIPQGYRRVDGAIVEDPEVAPVIRQIFELYATGRFSFQTLADHLNRLGIRPRRGPSKSRHNRPAAVIFTGDVLKDILDNPSYLGKVKIDGQLIEAKHPALIDEVTWTSCLEVRRRNRRNTSGTWTRHSYPLTPVLRCGRCGSTMHGEISSNNRRTAAYYACHAARRNRSATMPRGPKCDARWIPASHLDTAIRDELQRCAPSDVMHAAYREQLGRSLNRAHDPRALADAAIHRLDEQLARSRRLYEFGEYDWDTFMAKRAQIQEEQHRLRNEAAAAPSVDAAEWCRAQILDLLAAWEAADDGQRSRLLTSLFESIEAEALPDRRLKLTAIPRGGWQRFFQVVVLERETGLEPATSTLGRLHSTVELLPRASDVAWSVSPSVTWWMNYRGIREGSTPGHGSPRAQATNTASHEIKLGSRRPSPMCARHHGSSGAGSSAGR